MTISARRFPSGLSRHSPPQPARATWGAGFPAGSAIAAAGANSGPTSPGGRATNCLVALLTDLRPQGPSADSQAVPWRDSIYVRQLAQQDQAGAAAATRTEPPAALGCRLCRRS